MIPRLDIPQRTNIFLVRKLLVAQILIFLIVSLPICYSAQYSLSYDANGNLVTGDGKYRVYNSLNQLSQIYNGTNSSGLLLESYQYHPTEERVHVKTVYNATGGIKETTYYISKSFVQVVNSSGEFNYTYVYQNGQFVAQKNPDGTKYFIISDAEGSATVVTNATGQMIENTSYSPFGEIVSGGTKSRYGYEDKERDSLVGDTDFNFRKYKPELGIFLQPDTLIQNVYDPQSLNRYMFERGNPYKYADSDGHLIWFIAIPLAIILSLLLDYIFNMIMSEPNTKEQTANAALEGAVTEGVEQGLENTNSGKGISKGGGFGLSILLSVPFVGSGSSCGSSTDPTPCIPIDQKPSSPKPLSDILPNTNADYIQDGKTISNKNDCSSNTGISKEKTGYSANGKQVTKEEYYAGLNKMRARYNLPPIEPIT